MTSRHWCLTFFTEPKIPETSSMDKVRYGIFGEEIAPTTQKKHWQSYIELSQPVRHSYIKKLFADKTVHCEIRKGSREEARDYCKKDGKFTEIGSFSEGGQGTRVDLKSITDKLVTGTPLDQIMLEEPSIYCRYRNGLRDIQAHVTKQKTEAWREVHVMLLTGPTGCGKTRFAMENSKYKIQGGKLAWWQDYNGEEAICIDEYNNNIIITDLLELLDGYQCRLNIKGSHTYANWTKVFITTNLTVDQLHADAKPAHRAALFRRINEVVNFWPVE